MLNQVKHFVTGKFTGIFKGSNHYNVNSVYNLSVTALVNTVIPRSITPLGVMTQEILQGRKIGM